MQKKYAWEYDEILSIEFLWVFASPWKFIKYAINFTNIHKLGELTQLLHLFTSLSSLHYVSSVVKAIFCQQYKIYLFIIIIVRNNNKKL